MIHPDYFKGKKVTVMGLGLLGRGIGDIKFLAEAGAILTVTDLKKKEELEPSLAELTHLPNITFVLGEHRMEDFENKDFILKAAGVPLDSPYIAHARENNIPIEMDASLFAKLAKGVTIVGVTGTRGKTTTTLLIYEILKKAHGESDTKVFAAGNLQGRATLPLIREVKEGDIVVLELDSWQLQGFGEDNISPHIAVFTNFMDDHLNYYSGDRDRYLADKANIFLYQSGHDILVVTEGLYEHLKKRYHDDIKSHIVFAHHLSPAWKITVPGEHNRHNVELAVGAARALNVDESIIQVAVQSFKGVPGRLQRVGEYRGVEIYNDTTSTTPDATLAGLKALSYDDNVVLIMGGADKHLDMSVLVNKMPKYAKRLILLPGSGTERLETEYDLQVEKYNAENLEEAVREALHQSLPGDIVLFSPGFASFGMFKNEYDRGEQFNEIVSRLQG